MVGIFNTSTSLSERDELASNEMAWRPLFFPRNQRPDKPFLDAAEQGDLDTRDSIAQTDRRQLDDTHAKLRINDIVFSDGGDARGIFST